MFSCIFENSYRSMAFTCMMMFVAGKLFNVILITLKKMQSFASKYGLSFNKEAQAWKHNFIHNRLISGSLAPALFCLDKSVKINLAFILRFVGYGWLIISLVSLGCYCY